MKTYQTKQKKILLSFLERNSGNPLTIEEIAAGLAGEDAPGKSTVYRLMNQLVEEGMVRRFSQGSNRHFVYQLLNCHGCEDHMHCRCVSCGKLFHMDSKTSSSMQKMLASTGFSLDAGKTTLLGTCNGCGAKERL